MCTSLTLPTADGGRLFGRTLDLDTHFGERVVLTQRDFPYRFRYAPAPARRYALLGMASAEESYPLYAEAMNERGLCMAGLRFAGNARYADRPAAGKVNLAPWELIPYLLGRYATIGEVRNALREIQVVGLDFSPRLPAAPLHWHIADRNPAHGELVVEVTADGMRVFDNPVGVLTNNPPFLYQLIRYTELARLTPRASSSGENIPLPADFSSLGDGGVGLPGDYSSPSRFVRAATLRRWVMAWMHTPHVGGEAGREPAINPVAYFFRILAAVSPMAGAVLTPEGTPHRTLYTCCMDARAGVYHYHTEEDHTLHAVSFAGCQTEGLGMVLPFDA